MMGHKDKMRGGDEYDALTRWRRVLHWKPGERKKIKRAHNKRVRREANSTLMGGHVEDK